MKVYAYKTLLDDSRQPFLKEEGLPYKVDGRMRYDRPDLLYELALKTVYSERLAEEYVYMFCMDRKCHITGLAEISHGSATASHLPAREIYQKALMLGAVGIVIMHNHPTGDCSPSNEDQQSTRRLAEAGKIIGIDLLDHIVVGHGSYVSMKEQGTL